MALSKSAPGAKLTLLLLGACSIPIDIGPIDSEFEPQTYRGTTAILGFPREKVDVSAKYGGNSVGRLKPGDTVSIYLLYDNRDEIPIAQLGDTVRKVNWGVAAWRIEGSSHYGEDGIAAVQHRDSTGRGLLTALKPGLVYLRAAGYGYGTYIAVYSCTREDCIPVSIFIE